MNRFKNVLFDLDGTLLPMDEDRFVELYFGYLCRKMIPYGFDSGQLQKVFWKGVKAMYMNDGTQSNEDAFWKVFTSEYGVPKEKYHDIFVEFYTTEFNQAIVGTQPSELAAKIIDICKDKNLKVILATNPLFPRVGTVNRIHWAGLNEDDFSDITTYENSHFCKPNIRYYQEIIDRNGIDPKESIMIGNDITEDLAASQTGMKTYLVTDFLLNKGNGKDISDFHGSLEELYEFIKQI